MATGGTGGGGPFAPRPVRCRCGHLPTHHMLVVPIPGSASFRLEAGGPCTVCGEAVCRRYAPGARDSAPVSRTPA